MIGTEPIAFVSVLPDGANAARLDLSDRIVGFEYVDAEHAADKLKLTIDNNDLSNFDDPIWRKGNLVDVTWGYPEAMAPTRRCQIRKVTGFQTLTVEAHGLEVLLNTVARCRTFENMSRSDVVKQIAIDNGYGTDDVQHIEDTEVVYPTIVQARLTDAQFIRRLAHREGFEWYIDFDGFHFRQRDMAQRPVRVIEWGGPEVLQAPSVENDVTGKPGSVRVASRNPLERRTIEYNASHLSETKRGVLGDVVEVPSFFENVATLEKEISTGSAAVATAAVTEARSYLIASQKTVAHQEIMTAASLLEAAVQRFAAGRFRRAQHVAVKMTLPIVGDPNLLAKSVIELRNFGKRLSQRYYVKEVTHAVKDGYKCTLKLISDGSGGHSTKSAIAVEASAIQVGPRVLGRRGPPAERRSIDAPPELKPTAGKDGDGHAVRTFHDQRHRETHGAGR